MDFECRIPGAFPEDDHILLTEGQGSEHAELEVPSSDVSVSLRVDNLNPQGTNVIPQPPPRPHQLQPRDTSNISATESPGVSPSPDSVLPNPIRAVWTQKKADLYDNSGHASSSGAPSCKQCGHSGKDRAHWYCDQCRATLCDVHWELQLLHDENKLEPGQLPHSKVDKDLERLIRDCMRPQWSDEKFREAHEKDSWTTWFGVSFEENGEKLLRNCDRFEQLMFEWEPPKRADLCPSIVSFVGETGAGKSSIIALLIKILEQDTVLEVPVVGLSKHGQRPTSGDVHLYLDPVSITGSHPILYADYEGMNGGNREPTSRSVFSRNGKENLPTKAIRYMKKLVWGPEVMSQADREFIVLNLYSRILYTFSDVVVFVLTNTRTIESVILKLLEWGEKSAVQVSNQPVLPHAIIVLNNCENNLSSNSWNVQDATDWLLGDFNDLYKLRSFERYIAAWKKTTSRQLGVRRHPTAKLLLQQFYTSVKAIRLPSFRDEAMRPELMKNQLLVLHDHIVTSCQELQKKKREFRTILSADQFSPYVQFAFDHFLTTEGLQTPFDFFKASFIFRPVPQDFTGYIVSLAGILISKREQLPLISADLFDGLTRIIASCIALDAERKNHVGNAEVLVDNYKDFCIEAIERICGGLWPCAEIHCVNRRTGHAKGCQDSSGRVLKYPDDPFNGFKDNVDLDATTERFLKRLRSEIKALLPSSSATKWTFSDHIEVLRQFYGDHGGGRSFQDSGVCFSCLMGVPQHPLPCRHIICQDCILDFGRPLGVNEGYLLKICGCPLEKKETRETIVRTHPREAGVRVLTLDGGGIRGITQLVILQELTRRLGGIPIYSFFDLVVGTSVGAIIGAGFAKKGWDAEDVADRFRTMCKIAFQKSTAGAIVDRLTSWEMFGFLKKIYWVFPQFRTDKLETSLAEAFGQTERLYGNPDDRFSVHYPKLAITTAKNSGGAYVIATYNRQNRHSSENVPYTFHQSGTGNGGWKTWQALRASSAAPTWFASYNHQSLGQRFVDGGMYYNNPIDVAYHESRLLWPDSPLDTIISLGTGYEPESKNSNETRDPSISIPATELFKIVVDQLNVTMDSEKTWKTFRDQHNQSPMSLIRLNTALCAPIPELHEADRIDDLEDKARGYWTMDEKNVRRLDEIANQLLARSFFLVLHRTEMVESRYKCQGRIHCRFSTSSPKEELSKLRNIFARALEQKLQRPCSGGHLFPCFIVKEQGIGVENVLPISEQTLGDLPRGNFALDFLVFLSERTSICEVLFCLSQGHEHPISGCPRVLSCVR